MAVQRALTARITAGLFASWQVARDWLFPPCCMGCGRVDTHWCPACTAEVRAVPLLALPAPLAGFDAALATGWHQGRLRDAVHALKYDAAADVAPLLGERLAALLRQQEWTFDSMIPVPLHAARLRERGYNQAQRLCDIVAAQTGIPHDPTALRRERDTGHQVGLNHAERQTNVADAFIGLPERLSGQRLLLIDDVRTTGATLSACAHAARQAGAAAVYGLTVTAAAQAFT